MNDMLPWHVSIDLNPKRFDYSKEPMIRKRISEPKAMQPVVEAPRIDRVNIALHAMNTFPKAFFVWGIVDDTPMRPKEMESKLQRDFPYLQDFPFLNRNNFNQYCQRSLKHLMERDGASSRPDDSGNGNGKECPSWRLVDVSIKPAAGFLLTRCVQLGVNCESFMANGRNSCPQSNELRVNLLDRLSQFVSQTVDRLADYFESDTTTIDRHLVKMSSAGLIEYHVPPTDGDIRKRSVKGAYARITLEGQSVAKEILPPTLSFLRGEQRHIQTVMENQPTPDILLKAMHLYAESISSKAA